MDLRTFETSAMQRILEARSFYLLDEATTIKSRSGEEFFAFALAYVSGKVNVANEATSVYALTICKLPVVGRRGVVESEPRVLTTVRRHAKPLEALTWDECSQAGQPWTYQWAQNNLHALVQGGRLIEKKYPRKKIVASIMGEMALRDPRFPLKDVFRRTFPTTHVDVMRVKSPLVDATMPWLILMSELLGAPESEWQERGKVLENPS